MMITIQDFKNIELIVAQIQEAVEHPDADRLYVLKVDTGKEVRQLVAGIRQSYTAEELIGRKVVMIANLEPATIRGQESQGMVLAVGAESGVALLGADRDVPVGSVIR